jgi:S1-C subfamily serine protease
MNPINRATRRYVVIVLSGFVGAGAVATIASARDNASVGTGVVLITTRLGYQGGAAAGTGMVLTSSGEVLTNNHVIAHSTSIRVSIPGTSHSYSAHVVGYAVSQDVAVIQLDGASNLKTVSTAAGAKVSLGQKVSAVGNAGGRGVLSTATGSVTGTGRSIVAGDDQGGAERLTGLIETDAGVEPGDSGGPLLNSSGKVIGMVTAASSGYGYRQEAANDAYAIPISRALRLATQMAAGKSSSTVHIGTTAFLGVSVGSGDGGATIADVVSDGPAADAGLQRGDVIVAVNGKAVGSASGLTTVMLGQKAGSRVSVTYLDGSGRHSVTVKLGSGPPQ